MRRAQYQAIHGGLLLAFRAGASAWHTALAPHHPRPTFEESKQLLARYRALLARDLQNVEDGHYPQSLLQFPWSFHARVAPEAIGDVPRIWRRHRQGDFTDLPSEIEGDYPPYYLRNFHWQTDGWFSDHSARIYDTSVEFLFLGLAEVMRRMAIPPIVDAARAIDGRRARIADIACGTGRFLQQLHSALPTASYCGVDLSPHYLRRAGDVLGDVDDLSLVHDNAESLSAGDGVYDVVTSVLLFHELPHDVRRTVLREMWRVLRPGGRLVICDSIQQQDSAPLSASLESFPRLYHEPFYEDYLHDPLESAVTDAEFELLESKVHFVSKVVVATRPEA